MLPTFRIPNSLKVDYWTGRRDRWRPRAASKRHDEESVEVGPAAEPACAKAAGSLRSPGQCDGAGGGSRRAPGLDLRAGLGSGAVLSVRGGPTVEWQP